MTARPLRGNFLDREPNAQRTIGYLGPPAYRAVKTSRLFEQIVRQVEDSILNGQLKPGVNSPPSATSPSALV